MNLYMPAALKLTLVISCAVAVGWFSRAAVQEAIDRIFDWKEPALWAVMGAVCVATLLILF